MVVELNGLEMFYEQHGTGQPLLWLHGFMGFGADWRHVFDRPPDGVEILAPDLRGHGRSTSNVTFSHAQCARDVLALMDHLQIDRIHAVGLSGGGIVLLHMATLAPARLDRMVIISAPPYFPSQARQFQRQFSPEMLSDVEMRLMHERHQQPGQRERLFEQARAFAERYDDVNFTPPLLSTITAETLIVFGDRDPLYPVDLAFALKASIPRSYLWVVPNGGHGPVFGSAAPLFADTALAFLRGGWADPERMQ